MRKHAVVCNDYNYGLVLCEVVAKIKERRERKEK